MITIYIEEVRLQRQRLPSVDTTNRRQCTETSFSLNEDLHCSVFCRGDYKAPNPSRRHCKGRCKILVIIFFLVY